MEVLTGDRKIPNPEEEEEEEFPRHVSPFSETAAAMLQSTTPQKLRIRCNGRSPSVGAAADPGQLGSGTAGDNGSALSSECYLSFFFVYNFTLTD